MGRVASKLLRPVKNFNVENRAKRVIEAEKPRSAPRHPSTAAALKNFAEDHPEYLSEQKVKHEKLNDFLKQVKVDSVGDNPEIRSQRAMPADRRKTTPAEYGFPDPEQIPEGRASLRQMLEFISRHRLDPKENSADKIAADYRLDVAKVRNVLKYFQTLHMHIPKAMLKKNPKLLDSFQSSAAPGERQTLKGMDEVAKLGSSEGVNVGGGSSVDPVAGPHKSN